MQHEFENWHKATYSGSGEDCVEQGIAPATGVVGVRDTKEKGQGPILTFAPDAWKAFLADVTAPGSRFTGGLV